jgi:predicted enzyme related to lactoylglutathione lyase
VWEELTTNDIEGARDFYAKILDWKYEISPISEGETYTNISTRDGDPVGGAYGTTERPTGWMSYIGVESADDAVAKARELGAEIVAEPFDVMKFGRMATIKDPAGAYVSIWQPYDMQGSTSEYKHGTVAWREIRTNDIQPALDFYSKWIGWKPEAVEMGDFTYWTWNQGDTQIGGAFQATPDMGPMPPHWGVIFNVDDVDAAYKLALANGATSIMAPDDIPSIGRYAGLIDPQGAAFGVMKYFEQ